MLMYKSVILSSGIKRKKLVHWYSCEVSLTGRGTSMTLLFWTNSVVYIQWHCAAKWWQTSCCLLPWGGIKVKRKRTHGQMKWVGWHSNHLPYNPHSHYTWPMWPENLLLWAWRRIVSSGKKKYLSSICNYQVDKIYTIYTGIEIFIRQ